MHPRFFLSVLSAGALTLALPYISLEPTTTTSEPATGSLASVASTVGLHLSKASSPSPNITDAESSIERRSNYGWIGSFEKGDCSGDHHKNRPKLDNNDCIPFTPDTDFVGVSWGSWPLTVSAFDAFTDQGCKNFATKTIKKPNFDNAKGPGSCYQVSKLGGHWGSIRLNLEA